MEWLAGTGLGAFLGVTVVLFGGAGFLMGQALAQTWRPMWHAAPYAVLMAAGDRFLAYALFEGTLFAVAPYLVGVAIIGALAVLAYGLTRARAMTRQYPWLYEADGLFGWRDRPQAAGIPEAGSPNRHGH